MPAKTKHPAAVSPAVGADCNSEQQDCDQHSAHPPANKGEGSRLDLLVQRWQSQLPSAAQALSTLAALEREINQATGYGEIISLIRRAEAIKLLLGDIIAIKQKAEWVMLLGNRRVGVEIKKMPKGASGRQAVSFTRAGKPNAGRKDTGLPGTTRARLLRLAAIEAGNLREMARSLWDRGKDATVRAVLGEGAFADAKAKRSAREKALAKKICELPDKKYGVVLADPEWRFRTYSERGKTRASAENHYPTSALETIKARPVHKVAAADCVLFLWAVGPMLPQALEVMNAWGFRFVSHAVWDKMKPGRQGTGYWFVGHHELLLVGVKGKPVAPAQGTQASSIMRAKSKQHSRKPVEAYEIIEHYFYSEDRTERARQDAQGLGCLGSRGRRCWGRRMKDDTRSMMRITFFENEYAKTLTVEEIPIWDLRLRILTTVAPTKEQLPWLKLAQFGDKRTDADCLRNDANVNSISGVEMDYDGQQVSFDAAVATIKKSRLQALLYTSPSHSEARPRWRVLAPTARDLAPTERAKLAARLNGAFGGIFASESFTLSQSYFLERSKATARIAPSITPARTSMNAAILMPWR